MTCTSCASDGGLSYTSFGYTPQTDAFGRLRVSQPYTLFDSQQRYALDDSFVSNVANGGSVSYVSTQSSALLTVTSSAGSYAARETTAVFTYQPGKSLLALMTFCMSPIGGLVQRVGYYGVSNGYYLEVSDQVYIVERSNVTGVVTETRVSQNNWNINTFTGVYPSTTTVDFTKTHIFWLDMEWLGVGNVRTGFVLNGQFQVAHIFQHANYNTTAYITTATLPVRYEIQSTGSSGTLTQICSTVMSEGGYDPQYSLYSNLVVFSRTMSASTWTPVMSIRLDPTKLDAVVQIRQVDTLILTQNQVIQWALWGSTTLTGASWVAHSSSILVQIDQSATSMSTTGAYQVASGLLNGSNQTPSIYGIDLSRYSSQLTRNSFTQTPYVFTLAFYSTSVIGGSGLSAQALLSWNELL